MNKIVKRSLIIGGVSLLTIVAAAGITVASLWHNELSTLMSFKKLKDRNDDKLEGDVYSMNISGDFYFEKFLDQGGVSTDSELISFITKNITKGIIPMEIEESEIACSAFTAKTPSGDVLFARNYDFSKTNTSLVFTKPGKGRHSSISTIDLQFLGIDVDKGVNGLMDQITCLAAPYVPLDGINDAGVSCAIFMSYQGGEETIATNQTTDKKDITSTTMQRLILDYADTVEEAVELVSQYDLHDSAETSYHYMVADATGKSAILEWVGETDATDNNGANRELVVTYNDNDSNIGTIEGNSSFQWVTNFIIQPDYYESNDDKAGYDRYMSIYEQLNSVEGVVASEDAAMEILKSVGRRTFKPNGRTITVHSVVYNLTQKTVNWVSNENYGDASYTFKYSL